MPYSKYMIDAVAEMCANKWLYLDKVKIKIILPFLYMQLLISSNKGIKGWIIQNKG